MPVCANKECLLSSVDQPMTAFSKAKRICKTCGKRSTAAWRSNNRIKHREYSKNWYKKYPDRALKARLWAKHKLSVAQYYSLLKTQNNCCAICAVPQEEFAKGLFVDHDHATGVVRGLLCSECNLGIGKLFDCPALCYFASVYLSKGTP